MTLKSKDSILGSEAWILVTLKTGRGIPFNLAADQSES